MLRVCPSNNSQDSCHGACVLLSTIAATRSVDDGWSFELEDSDSFQKVPAAAWHLEGHGSTVAGDLTGSTISDFGASSGDLNSARARPSGLSLKCPFPTSEE
jgi:hypothetical protein